MSDSSHSFVDEEEKEAALCPDGEDGRSAGEQLLIPFFSSSTWDLKSLTISGSNWTSKM